MAILEIHGKNGQVREILALRGEKGYTPQKGVDYFTEADKAALVAELGARDVDQDFYVGSTKAIASHAVQTEFKAVVDRFTDVEQTIRDNQEATVDRFNSLEGDIRDVYDTIANEVAALQGQLNGLVDGDEVSY